MKPQIDIKTTLRKKTRRPKIYLAGKISKNCWRHKLVKGLREQSWDDGPLEQDSFTYIGPFFVNCDHGCFHSNNTHGVITLPEQNVCPNRLNQYQSSTPHRDVANFCFDAVAKSNLVFCYINGNDCYGTVTEIGYAISRGIPVVIAFAPGFATNEDNDFWLACSMAAWVLYDVEESQLPDLLNRAIQSGYKRK